MAVARTQDAGLEHGNNMTTHCSSSHDTRSDKPDRYCYVGVVLVYIINSGLSRKATKVRDRLRLDYTKQQVSIHSNQIAMELVIINFCASPSSNAAAAAVPGVVSG